MAKKRANGEGNIRKRKDGRWEGRYTAGYDEKTGKRITKSVLGKTQAEVKEKLAKAVAEAESVDVRRADEYTLGTWLQTWYELYAKPHLRFSTAEYYRRGIELHITPHIGDIPLKKLTGRDLQWLYKDLQEHGRLREAQKGKQPGLSDSTIRGIHTMLHNAIDRAVKERLIVRNPADDCVPPKIPKHEMKILPPEQIKSYLTAAEQRGVLPMFYLELISGLRKGELVALQWSDLDIENKTISVSKQARRFDCAGNINARSAALTKKTPVTVQPNRKHRPRAEQPETEQCAAAEPDNLKNLCRRQRLCSRFCSFLCRGNLLLRGCLRLHHGLCRLLDYRRSLHGLLCALYRSSRVLRRKNRQRNQCSRQAELQKHDQPERIEHPLRHAVFEYRPHQKHNRYQRGNGQNFFQHEDSSCFSAASKMAFSS